MPQVTRVIATLRYEGIHFWRDCKLDPVMFLKDPHRHVFHIRCEKLVSHGDREVEIIMLKRDIEQHLFDTYGKSFGGMSCEHIATALLEQFDLSRCEVLEDGENGAVVEKL